MIKQGDLCPECKKGIMQPAGHSANQGYTTEPLRTVGEETGFQCDACGAKWNSASRSFTYRIGGSKKKGARQNTKAKGAMKKMQNKAKPRRQSPR